MDTETVLNFSGRLIDHYQGTLGRKIYIEFTGGEPTLNRDFLPILRFLKGRGAYCGVISNATMPVSFWRNAVECIDHVCLSFHPQGSSPARYQEVVEYLHSRVATHLNIMMNPEHFDLCLEVAERVAAVVENTSISLQPLFDSLDFPSTPKKYTTEQNRILMEKRFLIPWKKMPFTYRGQMRVETADGGSRLVEAPHFIASEQNRWKGWKCWAGMDGIVIYSDGNIYRGWCRQDRLGNVSDAEIKFPSEPTLCAQDSCQCNLDIMNRRELQSRAKSTPAGL
jgi:MoaA/NifB/PqqE/SkfB family radical SAM enzyme